MKYPAWLFGLASVMAGVLDLLWREFEPAHQPIQAWSDQIPGITFLAIAAGVWLIAGGASLLIPRAAQAGAAALTVLYAIFCLFPMPRLISAPHYLGHHFGVYVGVLVGVGQQVILLLGAVCLWLWLSGRAYVSASVGGTIMACLFGLCCVDFGLGHFTNVAGTAAMIPAWMPLGAVFWTELTGAAFLLAGVAIMARILDVLAARLLAAMLLMFSVIALTPRIAAAPHQHVAWGGDAYNLTAAGAAWIFSVWLGSRKGRAAEGGRGSGLHVVSAADHR